jgi:YesN/AraC family two-component response regulator
MPLIECLFRQVGKNYSFISKLFSKLENRTFEQYHIRLRIERVKEILDEGELNLGQIASKLGYSSVHYLSAQFKKVTGVSVTEYRKKAVDIERQSLHTIL